ncbi:ABC transporter permease [Lamprocystis purpurea]|jgi:hypothetical protein|uniref:ABC transporter permease n=1 Tax=Lamprocystis purpurea TaxID=61598 RepID=UPI0003A0C409|nr:ABC transporter permease [Lamprocystis purpurea]
MFPKGFWAKLVAQALTTPYLALLMVMSVLLTIASFYTTLIGLSDFTPNVVLAAFITMAIQSLLFVTSWRLGFMFADKEPLAWVDISVFTVCFLLSVFFSFASLFNVVFSKEQQELARITRVHNGVTEAITDIGEKARERRRELVQDLIKSPEYAAWTDNVTAVADLAADSQAILAKVFAESHERRRLRAEQLAREAQDVAASDKTLARGLRDAEADLERVDARRGPLEDGLAGLRAQLAAAEDAVIAKQHEMDAEERGVGTTGKPTRGPVWAALNKEQQRLIANRDAIKNRIGLEEGRRKELDTERSAVQTRIDQIREQQLGLGTRIGSAAKAAEEARRDAAAAGATPTGLDQSVDTVRANLVKFATTLNLAPFDEAAAWCQRLFTDMAAIPLLEQKVKGLSCDRGSMMTLLSPINEAAEALAAVERDCLSGGESAKTVDELSFDDALTYGRSCLDAASLPAADTRRERRELDRLKREESPQASPFTKTTNALLAGEKLAIFALLIALAIDLLVLFVGLIGARAVEADVEPPVDPVRPTDSPQVRLYKRVLAATHAVNERIDGARFDHRVVLSDIPEEGGDRELARQFLVGNIAKGLVQPVPRQDPQQDNQDKEFLLRYGTAQRLRTWLAEAAEPFALPPTPTPRAAAPNPFTVESRTEAAPPARPKPAPSAPQTIDDLAIDDLDRDFIPVGRLDLVSESTPVPNQSAAGARDVPPVGPAPPRPADNPAAGQPDTGGDGLDGLFR